MWSSDAAPPGPVYHYDPTRREGHLARLAAQVALSGERPRQSGRDALQHRPGARYIDYLMPGIVALNLMGSGVWGIGLSVVDSRKRKLTRQFATTPMRRSHFLLAYMLSRLTFLAPEVVLLFSFGALTFDTRVHGSLVAIALLSLIGALAFSGLGLLMGARASSVEAATGWGNLLMSRCGCSRASSSVTRPSPRRSTRSFERCR